MALCVCDQLKKTGGGGGISSVGELLSISDTGTIVHGTQKSRTVLGSIPNVLGTILNRPGFYPSILRHSGFWGAADEAVLNKILKKF